MTQVWWRVAGSADVTRRSDSWSLVPGSELLWEDRETLTVGHLLCIAVRLRILFSNILC